MIGSLYFQTQVKLSSFTKLTYLACPGCANGIDSHFLSISTSRRQRLLWQFLAHSVEHGTRGSTVNVPNNSYLHTHTSSKCTHTQTHFITKPLMNTYTGCGLHDSDGICSLPLSLPLSDFAAVATERGAGERDGGQGEKRMREMEQRNERSKNHQSTVVRVEGARGRQPVWVPHLVIW